MDERTHLPQYVPSGVAVGDRAEKAWRVDGEVGAGVVIVARVTSVVREVRRCFMVFTSVSGVWVGRMPGVGWVWVVEVLWRVVMLGLGVSGGLCCLYTLNACSNQVNVATSQSP